MEFKAPNPKKKGNSPSHLSLPSKNLIIGVFNGLSVIVSDLNGINCLTNEGNFGKTIFSRRTYNSHKDDIPKIIPEQQFDNESKWNSPNFNFEAEDFDTKLLKSSVSVDNFMKEVFEEPRSSWKLWKEKNCNQNSLSSQTIDDNSRKTLEFTLGVTPSIDIKFTEMVNSILFNRKGKQYNTARQQTEENVIVTSYCGINEELTDSLLSNIIVRLEKTPFPLKQTLHLSLEESFFLNYAIGCLKIMDFDNVELSGCKLWQKFHVVEPNFFKRYAVYHYYRSKGWIIKSGLKFGGDYLLYKDGPTYNHASYLVKILQQEGQLQWKEFIAINRLVETFNKDVIFCSVDCTDNISYENQNFPNCLTHYSIRETMSRRWLATKERVFKQC